MNQDQLTACSSIYHHVVTKTYKNLLLTGKPGTGKTYCLNKIVEKLCVLDKRILILSPTHKALGVINESFKELLELKKELINLSTIQSYLNMKCKSNKFTGEETFEFSYLTDQSIKHLNDYDLVIIDECSMISENIVSKLNFIRNKEFTLLLVGDENQLPPVNEEISKSFSLYDIKLELTEIVRQSNINPIVNLINNEELINSMVNDINDEYGYAFLKKENHLSYAIDLLANDDKIIYLCYTNKTKNFINSEVRKKVYGEDVKTLMVGETIISNENKKTNSYQIFNGQHILIESLRVGYHHIGLSLSMFLHDRSIPTDNMQRKFDKLVSDITQTTNFKLKWYLINEDSSLITYEKNEEYSNYMKLVIELSKEFKNWNHYFNIKESDFKFNYRYALSIHQSQGSTYEKVIFDSLDAKKNKKEKQKLTYTAISRAKNKLLILW